MSATGSFFFFGARAHGEEGCLPSFTGHVGVQNTFDSREVMGRPGPTVGEGGRVASTAGGPPSETNARR